MCKKYTPQDYKSNFQPTWCNGCSFYNIYTALTESFAEKSISPSNFYIVSGIGCSSRLPLFLNTHSLHTLHGRAIPVAIGIRLVKPEASVIVAGGDGDLFSIGLSHFVHAARKNFNITVLCMDNRMYAMTKKQSSPTSPTGFKGTLSPYGEISNPLDVIGLAIQSGATFVASTYSGVKEHMKKIITRALDHIGFSFVNVIAPCKRFDLETVKLLKSNVIIDINEELRYNPSKDKIESLKMAEFFYQKSESPKIVVGIFREVREPTFEEKIEEIKKKVFKKYLLPIS
ncbi:MAG: thiamine pyrophosphate-dependent enzyme [Chitinispirillaceae bacterium]|nr:thiamine pyrophosphate-dependent enzyme [Chitinispirillaceae bacterium]